jgi:hypothetical protein
MGKFMRYRRVLSHEMLTGALVQIGGQAEFANIRPQFLMLPARHSRFRGRFSPRHEVF